MSLSSNLISQFVKITNDDPVKKKESTVYGTTVEYNGEMYVKLDGSDILTPITPTVAMEADERVIVMIKNHQAVVTGNVTAPAASENSVVELEKTTESVKEATKAVEDRITAAEGYITDLQAIDLEVKGTLEAANAEIDKLKAKDLEVDGKITANEGEIDELKAKDVEIEGKVTASEGEITNLKAKDVEIEGKVTASEGEITNLKAKDVEIEGKVTATEGEITKLKAKDVEIDGKLTANDASIKNLEAENLEVKGTLESTNAEIENLQARNVEIDGILEANDASIKELQTDKLDAKTAEITYANIDFSNIGKVAMEYLYSESGLIKDVTIGDATITGQIVGVTISGDRIIGNTIIAEKLVIKGDDGLYYKLNTDGTKTEAEQTDENSLNGSIIKAKSITASKVNVDDLVAFDATIGGFKITKDSIYSGVKESIDNTTRGTYLDNEGQVYFGDGSNFLKYYKDSNGNYKLAISAESITIGSSNKNVESIVDDAQAAIDAVNDLEDRANSGEFKGEDATTLRIDSSRGTVFKNSAVETVLSVVIYKGSKRITDIAALREEYGNSAYLQWQWQSLGESTFGTILSKDSRIGNDGFTFTLSPADVNTKVVFMCQLITD